MADGTQQRMVTAAVESLRRRGIAGTSFTEVLASSGAARGAVYHHFPGGKAELVGRALEQTGEHVGSALAALPHCRDESHVIDAFLSLVRPVVEESAGGAGCAVAAIATEAPPGDHLQIASGEILSGWCETLSTLLHDAGASTERAEAIAALLIATLEGAHVLCRANASIVPFDRAAAAMRAAFASEEPVPSTLTDC